MKVTEITLTVKAAPFIDDRRGNLTTVTPDPKYAEWPGHYFGQPLAERSWPNGDGPIIYLYFWLNRNPANPVARVQTTKDKRTAFSPPDLFYIGERKKLSNFANGWVPIPPGKRVYREDYDSRYHWLPSAQNRQIFAVIFGLTAGRKYGLTEKRRSLEFLVAKDIRERYTHDRRVLEKARRHDQHPGWIRSSDVKDDARWILDYVNCSFGI